MFGKHLRPLEAKLGMAFWILLETMSLVEGSDACHILGQKRKKIRWGVQYGKEKEPPRPV